MDQEKRIRIDLVGKSGAKITKSTIVEAVKLLEQDPLVELNGTSRDIIEQVSKSLWATYKSDLVTVVTIGMAWNDVNNGSEFKRTTLEFTLYNNKIDKIPVYIALPQLIAKLIKSTSLVKILIEKDNFV